MYKATWTRATLHPRTLLTVRVGSEDRPVDSTLVRAQGMFVVERLLAVLALHHRVRAWTARCYKQLATPPASIRWLARFPMRGRLESAAPEQTTIRNR